MPVYSNLRSRLFSKLINLVACVVSSCACVCAQRARTCVAQYSCTCVCAQRARARVCSMLLSMRVCTESSHMSTFNALAHACVHRKLVDASFIYSCACVYAKKQKSLCVWCSNDLNRSYTVACTPLLKMEHAHTKIAGLRPLIVKGKGTKRSSMANAWEELGKMNTLVFES